MCQRGGEPGPKAIASYPRDLRREPRTGSGLEQVVAASFGEERAQVGVIGAAGAIVGHRDHVARCGCGDGLAARWRAPKRRRLRPRAGAGFRSCCARASVIARACVVSRNGSATVLRSVSETATQISASSSAISTGGSGGRELSSAASCAIRGRSSAVATRRVSAGGPVNVAAGRPAARSYRWP
jgi:hypothetical protein